MSWKIQSHHTNTDQLLLEESLFFTGNGYLGIRGNLEEGALKEEKTIRGTYINGFYDHVAIAYGEKMTGFPETQQKILNIMDTQSIQIWFGQERFSLHSGTVITYKRVLDMEKGYQLRTIHWRSPLGIEVKIHFKRIASFVYQQLFDQQITIESLSGEIPVTIKSTLNGNVRNFTDPDDPRVSATDEKHVSVTKVHAEETANYIEMATASSGLTVAALAELSVAHNNVTYSHTIDKNACSTDATFILNDKAAIHKRTIFADSIRFTNVGQAIYDLKKKVSSLSFSVIAEKQQAYLADFWQATDITISGDPHLQEAIRFNLYHILQSTGQDGITNISAKGLSGEGYEGHYFWDTEIYLLPIYTLTNPDLAKKLLLFRFSTLPQAKAHASEMGHQKGALFPWRTISGTECSSFFPAGSAQYHISADIAHSYIQYYLATKDMAFMKFAGVEMLIETARLWLDAGHFYNDLFRIDAVTGPDEYTCIVNNNYYTNVMAKQNLRWAQKAWFLLMEYDLEAAAHLRKKINLTDEELALFKQAADRMYLPVDEQLQINPQDDTFLQKAKWNFKEVPKDHYPLLLHYHPLTIYRYQVCKQADTVLAHLLVEDEQPESIIKNSYHYYEEITTHDSSLSSCVFSMMGARIGDMEKAYHYFMQSATLDLDNTQGNTKDGLHLANMGGTWMGIVVGFAGMRLKENGLMFRPQIPKSWPSYHFHFYYQGSFLKLTVTKKSCILSLIKGDPVTISVWEEAYFIKDQAVITFTGDDLT